jgi:pimeloyl-ACP methyl ester carboxylesterase
MLARALRLTALGLCGLVVVALVAAAAVQSVLTSREGEAYPPPGRLVDVGGYRLHIKGEGPTEVSPTVVLVSGATSLSVVWSLVQPEVARTMRVCSYDRAGLGWSDPGPSPRSAEAAARELHELLVRAAEERPYVLVGHSYGGIIVRKFFDLYPEDVAGLGFIDPWTPSLSTPGELDGNIRRLYRLSLLGRIGVSRFVPLFRHEDVSEEESERYAAIRAWPTHLRASADELAWMEESSWDPALESQSFGDLPVVVLTENQTDDRERRRFKWKEHRALADRSTRGVHIVVDGMSHTSFATDPAHANVVVSAIREIVGFAQSQT